MSHHAKSDLNKESGAMHQTLISFKIDAQGFRKTKNENPPKQEIGVTSKPVLTDMPIVGRLAGTG